MSEEYDNKDDTEIDLDDLLIVEEDDEIPEPTKEEIAVYASYLGFDLEQYTNLSLEIAYQALTTPLPENFKRAVLKQDYEQMFYINLEDGKVQMESPIDEVAQETYLKEVEKIEKKNGKKIKKDKLNKKQADEKQEKNDKFDKTVSKNKVKPGDSKGNKKNNIFESDSSDEELNNKKENLIKKSQDNETIEDDSDEEAHNKKYSVANNSAKNDRKDKNLKIKKEKENSDKESIEELIQAENNSDSEDDLKDSFGMKKKKKKTTISIKDKSIKGNIFSEDDEVKIKNEVQKNTEKNDLTINSNLKLNISSNELKSTPTKSYNKSKEIQENSNKSLNNVDNDIQISQTSSVSKKKRINEVFSPTIVTKNNVDLEVEKYKNKIIEIDNSSPVEKDANQDDEKYGYDYDKFDDANSYDGYREDDSKSKIDEEIETTNKVVNVSSCGETTDKKESQEFNRITSIKNKAENVGFFNIDLNPPDHHVENKYLTGNFGGILNKSRNDDENEDKDHRLNFSSHNNSIKENELRGEGYKYSFKSGEVPDNLKMTLYNENEFSKAEDAGNNSDEDNTPPNVSNSNNNAPSSIMQNNSESKNKKNVVKFNNIESKYNKAKQEKLEYLAKKNRELKLLYNEQKRELSKLEERSFNIKNDKFDDKRRAVDEFNKNKEQEFRNKIEEITAKHEKRLEQEISYFKYELKKNTSNATKEKKSHDQFEIDNLNKKIKILELEKSNLKEEVYLYNKIEQVRNQKNNDKYFEDLNTSLSLLKDKLDIEKKNFDIRYKNILNEVEIEEENKYYRELEEVRKTELFNVEKHEAQFKASLSKVLEEYRKAKEEEYDLEAKKQLKIVENDCEDKLRKIQLVNGREVKDQEEIMKNSINDIETHYLNSLSVIREELKLKSNEIEKSFNNKINYTLHLYEDKKNTLTNIFEEILFEVLGILNKNSRKNPGKITQELNSSTEKNDYNTIQAINFLDLQDFILKNYENRNLNYNLKKNKVKNIEIDTSKYLSKFSYLLEITREILTYFNDKNIIKGIMGDIYKIKNNLSSSLENNDMLGVGSSIAHELDPLNKRNIFESDIKEIAKKVAFNIRFSEKTSKNNLSNYYENLKINNSNNQMNFSLKDNLNYNHNEQNNNEFYSDNLTILIFKHFNDFVKDLFIRRFVYSDNTMLNEIMTLKQQNSNFFNNSINNLQHNSINIYNNSKKDDYNIQNNTSQNFNPQISKGLKDSLVNFNKDINIDNLNKSSNEENERQFNLMNSDKENQHIQESSKLNSNRPSSKISNRYGQEKYEEDNNHNIHSNKNTKIDNTLNKTYLNDNYQVNKNAEKSYNNNYNTANNYTNNNSLKYSYNNYELEESDILNSDQLNDKLIIEEFLNNTEQSLSLWKKILELKINKYETMKTNLFATNSKLNSSSYNLFNKYSTPRPNIVLTNSSAIYDILEEDQKALNRNFSEYEKASIMFQEVFYRYKLLFFDSKNLIHHLKENSLNLEIERIKALKKELEVFVIENTLESGINPSKTKRHDESGLPKESNNFHDNHIRMNRLTERFDMARDNGELSNTYRNKNTYAPETSRNNYPLFSLYSSKFIIPESKIDFKTKYEKSSLLNKTNTYSNSNNNNTTNKFINSSYLRNASNNDPWDAKAYISFSSRINNDLQRYKTDLDSTSNLYKNKIDLDEIKRKLNLSLMPGKKY